MPFPNEHSCRLNDPKKYTRFSRVNCDQKHNGKCIDVIYGKKKDGKTEIQALRFDKKIWTESAARSVCSARKGSFEPASKKKEKQSMDTEKKTAPMNACIFEQDCCLVSFAEEDKQVDESRFNIIGYSGGIIPNHWFWGNIAFDLAGTTFDKKKTAVLEEHFTTSRIGYTTKQDIDSNVRVEGKFLSNPKAQELRYDIKDGFPMQASLFIQPETIEHIKEDEKTEVNGKVLKGPGTVFRKARIREVSMCTLGADSHTQSKAFAEGGNQQFDYNVLTKEKNMETETKMGLSAETFAAEYPDLHAEVTETARAEGIDAERKRFAEIAEVCAGDHELAARLFAEGVDRASALSAKNEKLAEANKQMAEKLAEAERKKVDPAIAEFSDDASNSQTKENEKPKTDEERFTEEFGADKNIQDEFRGANGLADYIAFRRADEKGLVKLAGRR